jgi:CDP-paratose 2-epimerase
VTVITGGAGFIGTNLADALLARGARVRVLDSLERPGVERNLRWLIERHRGRIEVVALDLRDRCRLRDAVAGAGFVFHLAAQVAVTTSLDDPVADFETNLGASVSLLDELRRLPDPPGVVFTSTNKVYGPLAGIKLGRVGGRWLPVDTQLRARGVDESCPLDFRTPYGCSKGGADQYVLDWSRSYGVPAVVFRMSCIYGPHQHGNEDQGWLAHFLLRAVAGESLTIFGDGAQVRDILHVQDLVRAFLTVQERIGELAGVAFNVGGGPRNAVSLLQVVNLIETLCGALPSVEFAEERYGDQRWYVSNTTKLAAAVGWEPRIGAAEGVESLYRLLAPVEAAPA